VSAGIVEDDCRCVRGHQSWESSLGVPASRVGAEPPLTQPPTGCCVLHRSARCCPRSRFGPSIRRTARGRAKEHRDPRRAESQRSVTRMPRVNKRQARSSARLRPQALPNDVRRGMGVTDAVQVAAVSETGDFVLGQRRPHRHRQRARRLLSGLSSASTDPYADPVALRVAPQGVAHQRAVISHFPWPTDSPSGSYNGSPCSSPPQLNSPCKGGRRLSQIPPPRLRQNALDTLLLPAASSSASRTCFRSPTGIGSSILGVLPCAELETVAVWVLAAKLRTLRAGESLFPR
jgi:hypothetical protein